MDFHIEYLRRTHMFCYYCGSESDSVEELARKCPGRHLRGVLGGEGKTSVNKNKEKQVNCKLLIFLYQLTTFKLY